MKESLPSADAPLPRVMRSKVPEVTLWFWVIKILCTTVGETLADWVNMSLGVGLMSTALIFTVVLAVVLGWQIRLNYYVPVAYWLTVVVFSVTGTLYTDILTDSLGVPLAISTAVFAAALTVVFAVWFVRERTLSIHSIVTTPRELFYWLAVLVTFALGTAVGDWTLQITGWPPGVSVLLPAALIGLIFVGWRSGANAVLSFWLAYILTRPLGANLGDWLSSARADNGLGLGYAATSLIFLAVITAVVAYLTRTGADVIDQPGSATAGPVATAGREKVMLGYYAAIAALTVALLGWASMQPHSQPSASAEEDGASSSQDAVTLPVHAQDHFPAPTVTKYRVIVGDTLAKVKAGDQQGAVARIKDLESGWDEDQAQLQPADPAAWTAVDGQIDRALKAVRAGNPDPATEEQDLGTLLTTFG